MSTSTAAAILAGGHARRFGGQDKSRLVVRGRTIIVRQLDVLQRVTADIFIVAPDDSRFADLDVPVHADRVPGLGAIGGLFTALDRTPADRTVVVACDQPFLDEGLIRALVARSADGDGAWVRTDRGVEPFLACYCRSARDKVFAEIQAGQRRLSALGQALRMVEITAPDLAAFGSSDELLANINTPDDYARVEYRRR